jgi:aldehyde dehydrogenase (NAD+)
MSVVIEAGRNLVGGEWRDAARTFEVLDPADQRRVVGTVPSMSAGEVAEAYAAAAEGAVAWSATTQIDRGRVLLRAAALLRERVAEIAALLTREMGKTLAESTGEVGKSADFFEYYGGLGRSATGEVLAHERRGVTAYTRHEPLGVVLAITPWNDPLLTPARKLAPALLAGNSVVLKPASYTPLVVLQLARALDDAGLPPGVLNTVTGGGAEIGEALVANPALRAVSFTGSNEVGADLERSLLGTGVRLLAELGGKNATVVRADAPLERAVETIIAAGFAQAGQRCTATSRVIADRRIAARFGELLAAAAAGLTIGPGGDAETAVGPVVSASQRDSVLGFIERAKAAGARVLTGGDSPAGAEYEHGCFVRPTVLVDVDPDGEIWTEEVFGPVVAVVPVEDDDEALRVLNDSRYGLAAAIFTTDIGAADRFVAAAEVGQVAVNLPTSGWDVQMPFGGFKDSGSGHKEQGLEGLDFYRRTKTVAVAG